MALATQCPHCHTTFRVASDQLKLRGGIVRCGACQSIFDGNAHLIDLDALAAGKGEPAPAPAVQPHAEDGPAQEAAAAPAAAAAEPAEPVGGQDPQPVYTLDFDHTFDPLGILPKAAPASAPDAPETPFDDEAAPDAVADAAAPEAGPESEPASAPESAPESAPDSGPHEPEASPSFAAEAEPAPAPEASAYAPQGRIEPSFDLPVDEELVAQPLPDDEHAYQDEPPAGTAASAASTTIGAPLAASGQVDGIPPAALPLRASAAGTDTLAPPSSALAPVPATKSARTKAVEARTRRSRLTPTNIGAPKLRVPASTEPDEPEFVKRSRKQEESGRTRRLLMIGGAVLLALLLAAQLVLEYRNVLAARYPGARPVLNAGCAVLRCRLGLPAQIENLSIETGELSTLGVDTYSLNTLLRNQGSLVQAWPSIQLELTDANDKPLLRRVFGPADYLPQGVPAAAGFAARSEQPVRLNFALAGLKPSSYHMIVFYP
jgi:predicted Zn finger-like uncharacterized protein